MSTTNILIVDHDRLMARVESHVAAVKKLVLDHAPVGERAGLIEALDQYETVIRSELCGIAGIVEGTSSDRTRERAVAS